MGSERTYRIYRDADRLNGVLDVLLVGYGGMSFRMSDDLDGGKPLALTKTAAKQVANAVGDCMVKAANGQVFMKRQSAP
jgi:hypothetical protein